MLRFTCVPVVLFCALLAFGFTPRTGFVTLQFDDSHDYHYTHIYPLLEQYDFKGSFGYVTEASDLGFDGKFWRMREIYMAGHEVQDHTTRHDYMWATHVDTLDDGVEEWIPYTFANVATWDSLCERSLSILDVLGISVTGWNHPGGPGEDAMIPGHPEWTWLGAQNDSLYSLIGSRFAYALGYGVFANTAHLNLRGHNCPDRYPFFNVSHSTIDYRTPADVRTGIADAVASGLWYLAASHADTEEHIALVESLVVWLGGQDIEVLTCGDGVERIVNGIPDPYANQLPQAGMLHDRDGNGKPDGFAGCCTWDTTSAPPVAGCNCMSVYGDAEFYCYGPELGPNAFSIWMKAEEGMEGMVRIIWVKLGFEWEYLEECWNSTTAGTEWALVDSSGCAGLLINVEDEVDRIRFTIRPTSGVRVRVACPDFIRVANAGVASEADSPAAGPGLRIVPNPVRFGGETRIFGACCAALYDVAGRQVRIVTSPMGEREIILGTGDLSSGVYFIRDRSGEHAPAKVIISR